MNWYPGANRGERRKRAMYESGLDVLLAVTPENANYLSGTYNYIASHWRVPLLFTAAVNAQDGVAVVSGDFGIDPRSTPPYQHFPFQLWTESVDVRGLEGGSIAERAQRARLEAVSRPAQYDYDQVIDRVIEAVRSVAPDGANIGLELSILPEATEERIRAGLVGFKLFEAGDIFDDLRAIKDPDEIALLRLAAELTDTGIGGAIERLAAGQSATTVNSLYQLAIHQRVVSETKFAPFRAAVGLATIGFGADAPTTVQPGHTVKFDMQVNVGGNFSDIGRTVAFSPTADQRAIYAALREALARAEETVRPGTTFAEVHATGTRAMQKAGFANFSRGHLGHGVGMTPFFEEAPFIAPDELRPLAPGMVISLELPYYVYGVGAFQLERMLLVTADGHEALDQLPFELAIG